MNVNVDIIKKDSEAHIYKLAPSDEEGGGTEKGKEGLGGRGGVSKKNLGGVGPL